MNFDSAYTFTTFAGSSGAGSLDGVGSAAQFNRPLGLAVDSAGNVFVADSLNATIRRITPAGVVSTIAGRAGVFGTADGTNSAARFIRPYGIAVDGAGNLYVTDAPTIRKITPVGTNWSVSTIAGGNLGSLDGTNTAAGFNHPLGIAVDSGGNLYVSDTENHTIRKITPSGTNWVVSTIAGVAGTSGSEDGTNGLAHFFRPSGIAVDGATNVYVTDDGSYTIRKLTQTGTNWLVNTIAGSAGNSDNIDGTNGNARFLFASGEYGGRIAVDTNGVLYVTNIRTVRKITVLGSNWVVTTLAGSLATFGGANGTGTNASFQDLVGIAAGVTGFIYVSDITGQTIRRISSAAVVSTLAGAPGGGSGSTDGSGGTARFNAPVSITADQAGNLFVADHFNFTIRQVTSAGQVSTIAGLPEQFGDVDGAGSDARFFRPEGIAVDSNGNVFVGDNARIIRQITPAGVVSTIAGSKQFDGSADGTNNSATFKLLTGVAVDSWGNLYAADSGNFTIRRIMRSGTNWVVSTIAGKVGLSGSTDGTNDIARFGNTAIGGPLGGPGGLVVDKATNVYVADVFNNTIRKITPVGTNWVVTTIAGAAGVFGTMDGTGSVARFTYPTAVAMDSDGNLYVTDSGSSIIRKLARFGTNWAVSTIAGDFTPGNADGAGSAARFNYPNGITVDDKNSLYVADTGNNTIRKGVFTAYSGSRAAAYSAPPMSGQLTVTLLPPEANGQWRFPWELGWHDSGVTISNLVTGNYPIEFRNVPSYLALPIQTVQVTNGGPTVITNEYFPTLSAGDANSAPGSLTVFLGSTPPPAAGWRFLGESTPFFGNGFTTNLLPGTYLIEFAAVSGRVKPPSQLVQVNAGQPTFLSVNYLLAAMPPANVYLPFPVPGNLLNDETTFPFGFNGQLQSDTGFGSGVAAQTNVVLTAAHLVFNDQTLSYVNRAHWFFRRDAGVQEPLPQEARGFYLLTGYATQGSNVLGYAAQRTNDLFSGSAPEQSTPPSRNLDVAALYFLLPVAGGGHGGYLPSDAVPNTWLTSTALKMLVGYPVDGSQFGDASITTNAGKMYQTHPQPFPLALANDSVPGQQQQVYEAPWFLSYPGNSGGPLYVQLNGYYYPAAVYLGTRFSGSQPVSSLVRAIDSNVVNLITLAATQGDSGTNNTGGGVITIIPSQGVSANNPGYVQFRLGPPAAVAAGAGWRLQGDTAYSSATNYTRAVTSTNSFAVEFKSIPNWVPPQNQSVFVVPGILITNTATYTLLALSISRSNGVFRLILPATSIFRLQENTTLNPAAWTNSPNTISTNGSNKTVTIAPSALQKFYRLIAP